MENFAEILKQAKGIAQWLAIAILGILFLFGKISQTQLDDYLLRYEVGTAQQAAKLVPPASAIVQERP